jgi:para-aminobenzoate synthetase/4-amino-4-deoxychorismate lyase
MLVRDGRVHAMRRHVDRLAHSIGALYGMRPPAGLAPQLEATAAGLTGEHRLRVDVIPSGQVDVTAGEQVDVIPSGQVDVTPSEQVDVIPSRQVDVISGAQVTISARPVPAGYRRAVTLEPLVVPGGLGPHKWRDRRGLERIAARHRGTISGHETAPLLLDTNGTVLEAAWGNVWLLEGDALVTPPADGRILPGVTRMLLLERAPSLALRAREEPVSLERARRAPVLFATSAIRLAVPVTLSGGGASGPAAPVVDRVRWAVGPR